MCSAIARRMRGTGTSASPMPALGAGVGCARAIVRAAAPAVARASPEEMTAITSAFVILPPLPVPGICARSRSCSFASRRTRGESICERGPRSGTVATASAAGAEAAAGATGAAAGGAADDPAEQAAPPDGSLAGPVVGAEPEAGEEAAPPEAASGAAAPGSSISINAVPTGTVVPSSTRIFRTVPATGEGTSVSTLSVEISNNGSSRSTESPSRFSHFKIVPSTIVSPSCGIWIDVTSSSSPAGQPVDGRLDVGDLGQEGIFQRRREGNGHVGRGQPHDGRVEMLEGLLRDHCRDLRPDPQEPVRLVQNECARRLLDRAQDRLFVQRIDGAEVDDLRRDAALRERFRGLERFVHHRAVRDDRDVRAFALDVRRSDRNEELGILRDLLLDPAIAPLVLEDQ